MGSGKLTRLPHEIALMRARIRSERLWWIERSGERMPFIHEQNAGEGSFVPHDVLQLGQESRYRGGCHEEATI
jgi:hypothetical protein